jgi:hypothetical protein
VDDYNRQRKGNGVGFFFETKGMELLVKYTSVQIRLLASTEFCRDVLHGQREILTVANAMTENIKVNGRHQSCCWYTEISCHKEISIRRTTRKTAKMKTSKIGLLALASVEMERRLAATGT